MKRFFLSFLTMGLLNAAPHAAEAKISIFACEPEWAALAQAIGGDDTESFTATSAKQDPHHLRAKPSLIAAMRKADLVVCSGADLEVGWLPILLQKAGNTTPPLFAADYVEMLEKPEKFDRAEGDIHPGGNPHVHLHPRNILIMANVLKERLQQIDAPHSDAYAQRFDAFARRMHALITRLEAQAERFKNVPVIVHHPSFSYLLEWLHMKAVGTLEPKPGIPPTTAHLTALLQDKKTRTARVILRTPYEPKDASLWMSEKTGIPAITLPYTVGGDPESQDLFLLFEQTLALLEKSVP